MRLLLPLLLACGGAPAPKGGGPDSDAAPLDADADGVPAGDDCDDTDAAVAPGAAERCNGADDDCDGIIDEDAVDATPFYPDADGDGTGAAGAPAERACTPPAGTAASATDCDDADAAVGPGATERCNAADDDCDGVIDEDAADAAPFHPDADGDGHGDASAAPVWACAPPDGTAASSADCDDTDSRVSPDESERCNAQDDNCDGAVDEGFDSDGDGAATCAGDCDDADPAVFPGAAEACNTRDDDCNGVADDGGVCPCTVDYWPDPLHPYLYCTATTDWATADATCAAYGYRLVTFDSAAEGTWVEASVAAFPANYWWVGFTDAASEGSWGWTDGSPITYLNWSSGEPNNGHGWECVSSSEEDCAMIRWSGASWNDYPCACAWPSFVCEGDSEYRPQE